MNLNALVCLLAPWCWTDTTNGALSPESYSPGGFTGLNWRRGSAIWRRFRQVQVWGGGGGGGVNLFRRVRMWADRGEGGLIIAHIP